MVVDTPFRPAEAVPHGPGCSADHGVSTVAAYFGDRCPCCSGSCRFSGAAVEKTFALPQLQLVEKSVTFYVPPYLAVTCSVFAFGIQNTGLFWVMTSGTFPYSALIGSTLDTCLRQFTEAFGNFSHIFFVKMDLGSRS